MATFTTFDGLRLNYTRWEGTGRPVVLQHGFAADTNANWIAPGVVAALRDAGLTVISLDARGHGRSEKPHDEARYSEDTMARDVSALLDELELDDVALVGYSMGAIIALLVASTDKRISLLATGGVGAGIVDFGGVDMRVVTPDVISRGLLAANLADVPPGAVPFRRLADALGADRVALAAVARAARRDTPIDLAAIQAPTLVLAGDADLLAAAPERLAAAIPNARLKLVPGDHLAAVAHPLFSSSLLAFLTAGGRG
jgi:pimeloyl-ACP methyl ester carboxylesterase